MTFDWDKYYLEKHDARTTPDQVLVDYVSTLKPGRAVDLGAGEGADSIWMAQQGWKVTAVDFSKTALRKLLSEARRLKVEVNATCSPILKFVSEEAFDLVLLRFIHFPQNDRPALYRKCKSLMKMSGKMVIICIINPEKDKAPTLPLGIFPTRSQLVDELEYIGLSVEKSDIIFRQIEWSENDSFEGETLIAVMSR